MNWKSKVSEQLEKTAKANDLQPWGVTDTQFWQLGVQLPDKIMQVASADIATAAVSGRSLTDKSVLAILMVVLRSYLAGVRANYLWPEVAKYFNAQSGLQVQHGIYAARFREALGVIFASKLSEIEHHHRYVMLLLDEAGIGHDRAAIIMEFLLHLCEMDDMSGNAVGEFEQVVLDNLERFNSAAHSRGDVEALWRVLLRAGVTVFRIRQALQDYPDPLELQLWQWEDLRQFWLSATGEKLETVLPEAQQVFNALLPHFGNIISCDQVYALIRDGDIAVELPQKNNATPVSPDDIPLGKVIFYRNKSQVEAKTTETLGLTSDVAQKRTPDCWLRRGLNGYYIWSAEPFHVLIDGYSRVKSREIYNYRNGRLEGYIWSGRLREDQSVVVEESGIELERISAVLPQYTWRYNPSGPTLKLMGIKVLHHDGLMDAKVMVAENVVWEGQIKAGTTMVVPRKQFKEIAIDPNEAVTGVKVEVYSGERLFGYREIRLPPYPFAIVNRRILRPGVVDSAIAGDYGFRDSVLIVPNGRERNSMPESDAGKFSPYEDIEIPAGTVAFRLGLVSDRAVARKMRYDEHEWVIAGDIPSLWVDSPRKISIGPVAIHCTGSIYPVASDNTANVRLCVCGEIDNSGWALRLDTGSVIHRYALQPSTQSIVLASLLEYAPAAFHRSIYGLVRMELVHQGKPTGLPCYLYYVGDSAIPQVARPDEYARVIFSNLQLREQIITSDTPLHKSGEYASCTLVFPEVRDIESASGVTFIWKPECRGVSFSSANTESITDRINLEQAASTTVRVEGSLVGWSLQACLSVGDELVESELYTLTNINNPLSKMLDKYVFSVFPLEIRYLDSLMIKAIDGQEVFQIWNLFLSPCEINLDVKEASRNGSHGIHISASWLGLADREVTVIAKEGAEWISAPHVIHHRVGITGPAELSGTAFIELIDEVINLISNRVIDIELLEDGRLTASRQITTKSPARKIIENREELRNQILSLIKSNKATSGSAEATISNFILLIERYVLKFSEIPYDAARLEAVMMKSFKMTEQSGHLLTCLITRIELVERSDVPDVRPKPTCGKSILNVLENTLLLHVLAREYHAGTLDPINAVRLQDCIALQRRVVPAGAGRDWVTCMLCACRRLTADDTHLSMDERRAVADSMKNPVFSIGQEVKDLLL